MSGVRFLLLDSSIPGEFAGRLDPDSLVWLADQLEHPVGVPTLVALHHPPMHLGHPVIDTLGLQNPLPLRDALIGNVDLVATLVGHTHAATAATFAGRPLLVAPGVHSIGQLPWQGDGSMAALIDPAAPPALALHRLETGSRTMVSYFVTVSTDLR
ncbi:metallophosphoesterase family protein [Nakamurella lactea]|uniref:hypothetical protein n=1 Tax=Nakamurella lactea TaxID=459515 RepID=UPI00040D8CC9|nr:hypothetical protein [Nakamurella lactea]